MVCEISATHPAIDRRTPIASIPSARTVVHIEDDVSLAGQQLVEHVLTRVRAPEVVHVVQVAGTMHEHHRTAVGLCAHVFRAIDPRRHFDTIAGRNLHDGGLEPRARTERLRGGHRQAGLVAAVGIHDIQLGREIAGRVHIGEALAVGTQRDAVPTMLARDLGACATGAAMR